MKPSEFGRPWRRGFSALLDLVYPPHCALCGCPLDHGRMLCLPCGTALPRLTDPFCKRCGEPFDGAIARPFDCPNCKGLRFSFEFARPALRLDPGTRTLIHQLKYQKAVYLAAELGRLAADALADSRFAEALAARWPLVPVPLHRRRLLLRHFNQSREIAIHISAVAGLPVVCALARIRATGSQTRLGRKERMANLRDAFALTRAGRRLLERRPAGVILVDDVLTTGSTAEACAATLRAAGIRRVQVLTVMRG